MNMGQNHIPTEVLHYQRQGSGRAISILMDPIQIILYLCWKPPRRSIRIGSMLKIIFHITIKSDGSLILLEKREKYLMLIPSVHDSLYCVYIYTYTHIYTYCTYIHFILLPVQYTYAHKVFLYPYQYTLSCGYYTSAIITMQAIFQQLHISFWFPISLVNLMKENKIIYES